ncbi:hypothetical protein PB1_02510 [Bacillus methanolicus PB1]|uniref:Uncharacterized protein n=1 Tax=Bacillus methanolicus PB1 TaxID=997296 RepID=I3E5K4_BACMT|nr:hypothetical protein [Bacillus methanolicus]EIJ81775.1 hypothetical protein PB1_02510 [Bacillus methanolicus PB1]
MKNLIEQTLLEGKLVIQYVHRETKIEEFINNFKRVSDALTRYQMIIPNTVKHFLEFADGLKVSTEEEASSKSVRKFCFIY